MPTSATAGSLKLISTETRHEAAKARAHFMTAGIGSFSVRVQLVK